MKKIAFLGFGRRVSDFISLYRKEGLGDQLEYVGAFDIDVELAKKCAKRVNVDIPVFTNAKEMFETVKPEAVIIGSYDAAHLECFRHVVPYDIPVFVEKPLESTIEKAAELVKLANAHNAPVLPGHCMRFMPMIQRAKQILDEGRIGKVNSFRFQSNVHYGHGYFRTWMRKVENVGALIVEKGCHDLDILHMLAGSRTSTVFCMSKRYEFGGDKPNDLRCSNCPEATTCKDSLRRVYRDVIGDSFVWEISDIKNDLCVYAKEIDIHDDDVCVLELENGVHGTYVQNLYSPYNYPSRVYTLACSEGFMELDLDETEGDLKIHPRYGSKKEHVIEHFDYRGTNHYNADGFMLLHFYDVITGAAKPIVQVEDAYNAMAATVTAALSAEKRQVLEVPKYCGP